MPAGKLVLHPQAHEFILADPARLRRELQAGGLLGAEYLAGGAAAYLAGPRFLEWIMFVGCAPAVRIDPPAAGEAVVNFYYLELPPAGAKTQFLGGNAARTPRCPHCRHLIGFWREALADWQGGAVYRLQCGGCGRFLRLDQLHWRNCAAFATAALNVCGVFEGEAVPAQALLNLLEQASGAAWSYFYQLPEGGCV